MAYVVALVALAVVALLVIWIVGIVRAANSVATKITMPDTKPAEEDAAHAVHENADRRATDVLRSSSDALRRRVDELRSRGRTNRPR